MIPKLSLPSCFRHSPYHKPWRRTVTLCRGLALFLFLILGSLPHSSGRAAPDAVGDNSVFFTGFRPSSGFDLSGYIEVPYSAALNPSGGSLTIEAWVKRNETNRSETIVGNGWQTSYWLGFSSSGKLRFIPHGADSIVDSNATVAAGRWTHVAVTYDGATRRFYINGVLDKSTTEKAGALAPAAAGQFLGIGFDRDDNFTANYLGGHLDTLRIWNVVRSSDQIEAGMFQTFGATQPGLLAEWAFNGTAVDPAGGHDGALQGNVAFSNDGAIPRDVRVPQVGAVITLDGACSPAEYANATKVSVDSTPVWLMHTAGDFWICFDDLGPSNRYAQVYLDAEYTRLDPAQPEHLQLRVENNDQLAAFEGDGNNGYNVTTAAGDQWHAHYTICCGEFPTRQAEFRLSSSLVGGWSHVIGLALGKSTGLRDGLDLWPALAFSNLPSTWSSATLAGIGPARNFSGQVVYQPRDSAAGLVGIAGVAVNLIGSQDDGGEALVATVQSNLNGNFNLATTDDYPRHRLELGAPPKGYLAATAEAPAPGLVVDARTVDYGETGAGAYTGNIFALGDALPYQVDSQHGPYFLIIAPDAIVDSGALDEFTDFKRRIGFSVEIKSIESIDAEFGGADRMARIRALEKARLNTLGSRFQYLMLVGTDDEIPFARFVFWFAGYVGGEDPEVDLQGCLDPESNGIKIKYSDWVYADPTGNFDSNGNGCLGDGVAPDLEHAPGYTSPDARPAWQADVAVGRLPFATESAVRTALANSMAFEMQSGSFKRRTVMAMSQPFLKGQFWTPKDGPDGHYMPCSGEGQADKNCQGATTDGAYVAERMRSDFLDARGYTSTTFYEATKPEGAAPVQSPLPLTGAHVIAELDARSHGFVNLAGHGSSGGVSRTFWSNANSNNQVDSPTEPLPFTSVDEISGGELLYKSSFSQLTPDNGQGSVYFAAACSTGSATNPNNFGATLLQQGHGVAWIGALNMINVGPWTAPGSDQIFTTNYEIVRRLLDRNLRIGDAVWQALEQQQQAGDGAGSAGVSTDLYGDPTLSYWGNPGGQSTHAAWPMLRYDGRGFGYSPLAGPEVPKKLWEYSGAAPGTATVPAAPVVSNNGEVIVAHGARVDVLRQGSLYQRLELDAAAFGTPAVSADGTIYVMDVNGKLYAFPYTSYVFFPYPLAALQEIDAATADNGSAPRYRRWALALGGAPATSPIVGPDGFIAVGAAGVVRLIRPDGVVFNQFAVSGRPVGAIAVDGQRRLYVATSGGYLGRLDFFCPNGLCVTDSTQATAYSTPPLLAYGSVYAGRLDGTVVKFLTNTSFSADSSITAGPVAGPAGQILVGTQNGTLYSLTADLTLRWQRNLGTPIKGMPAFSVDALYVVAGDRLYAFSPFSGAPLWARNLGAGTGHGSAVVGYNREIFLQTSSGRVFAYGEGWSNAPVLVLAEATTLRGGRSAIQVRWAVEAPPLDAGAASVHQTEAVGGLLVQRRSGDGQWQDLAVLPAGTTVMTDTDIAANTVYAYRVKVLAADGNDSDYTGTMPVVQSLPALPGAPTIVEVVALGADRLEIRWTPPAGSVVDNYWVEHATDAAGPWMLIAEAVGDSRATLHEGLAAGSIHYYRVAAANAAGAGDPSAAVSGTTRQQTLPAPQNATATLFDDGRVQIDWTGTPQGAATVIEMSEAFLEGWEGLATVDGEGYSHYPGEASTYAYRLKFVLGDAESEAIETNLVIVDGEAWQVYLPLTVKE